MVEIFNNFDDLRHLRDEWNALSDRHRDPLSTYEWFESAANAFHADDEIRVFCCFENGNLSAIAPLFKDSKSTEGYKLEIIGSRRLYEPFTFLHSSRSALNLLLEKITDHGYPAIFNRLWRNRDLEECMSTSTAYVKSIPSAGSQYLDIDKSFSEYLLTLSPRRRSDLRRAMRKARELGQVAFSIKTMSVDAVHDHLQCFYKIEHAGWKGDRSSSIIKNPSMRHFIDSFFKHMASQKAALSGFMSIDNVPVAGNLSLIQHNRIWTLKIGYDTQFNRISPGILMTHEMIRYAHDNEFEGFEFLGSTEKWINQWNPQERDYITYLYYPHSLKGLTGIIADTGRRIGIRINRMTNSLRKARQ